MEVDLGAISGGPNHQFSLSLNFGNWVHLQVRIGLGLCSGSVPCFQKKCLRMRGKRESKFCASHNSQRHLGVGGQNMISVWRCSNSA